MKNSECEKKKKNLFEWHFFRNKKENRHLLNSYTFFFCANEHAWKRDPNFYCLIACIYTICSFPWPFILIVLYECINFIFFILGCELSFLINNIYFSFSLSYNGILISLLKTINKVEIVLENERISIHWLKRSKGSSSCKLYNVNCPWNSFNQYGYA